MKFTHFFPTVLLACAGAVGISSAANAGTLEDILKRGELRVAVQTQGPPFSMMNKKGELLTDLTAHEIDEMFADGTISGGMLPKISSALEAAKSGVNTVHIVDGRIPHAILLEVLTEQAFGTMIRSH